MNVLSSYSKRRKGMAVDRKSEDLKRDVVAFLETGKLPERPASPFASILPDARAARIRRVDQMVRNIEEGSAAGITEVFTRDPHVNVACDIYRERQAQRLSSSANTEKVLPPTQGGPS
jgi:hypothetical protein